MKRAYYSEVNRAREILKRTGDLEARGAKIGFEFEARRFTVRIVIYTNEDTRTNVDFRKKPVILAHQRDRYLFLFRSFLLLARITGMNFESVAKTMNKLLSEKQPYSFNRSWVRVNAPGVYRFIQREIRIEGGGIDWDCVTRALNPKYQKQWIGSLRKTAKPYQNKAEVTIVLQKYRDKLYTFLTPIDKNDEDIRDIISIALVRIAQKGNISARQEIIKLLSFTIDDWIERSPALYPWRGYEPLIQDRLECCIRRYRYSGSFMRYLFKTFEYAARGLKPLIAYSLDDLLLSGKGTRIERIGQHAETGDLVNFC